MEKLIICFFNVEMNPNRLFYYINIITQQITLVQNHTIINLYNFFYVSCQYCLWMWSEVSCILNETNFNWLCTWTQNGSSMIVKCHSTPYHHLCRNGTHSKHLRVGIVLEFTTIFIRNLLLTAYFQILVEDQIMSCKWHCLAAAIYRHNAP